MDAVHISVVLDRSGSMASIADDIVAGFNEFLGRQRAEDGEARMTLAQFDDQDPFEVLIDGVPVREVTDLPREAYQPRGTTPLYDAIGSMIARIDAESAGRNGGAGADEDQLVVIVTDGLENASREHDRSSIFSMITDRRTKGWSFLFLGADQDSNAAGGDTAMARAKHRQLGQDVGGHRPDVAKRVPFHRAVPAEGETGASATGRRGLRRRPRQPGLTGPGMDRKVEPLGGVMRNDRGDPVDVRPMAAA